MRIIRDAPGGDPQNYDLMINTSNLPLEAAANLILSYIEMRQNADR